MAEKVVNIEDRDKLVDLFSKIKIENYDHDTGAEFALFTRLLKLKSVRENYDIDKFCDILQFYIDNGLRFNENLSTKKDISAKIYSFLTYCFSHYENAKNENNTILKGKTKRENHIIEAQSAEQSEENLKFIKEDILRGMQESIDKQEDISNYEDPDMIKNGIGCEKCISGYIQRKDGGWGFCDCYIKELLKTKYKKSGIPEKYLKYANVDDSLVELCALKNYSKEKEEFKGIALSTYIDKYKKNLKSLIFDGWNLIIEGPTGTLKTTTACIIGKEAINQNYSVLFLQTQKLKEIWLRQENEILKQKLYDVDVLILDDFGQEFLSGNSDYQLSELDCLLRNRMSETKSTIITTNATKEQIEKRYSNRIASLLNTKMMHLFIKTKQDLRKKENLPDFF